MKFKKFIKDLKFYLDGNERTKESRDKERTNEFSPTLLKQHQILLHVDKLEKIARKFVNEIWKLVVGELQALSFKLKP